MYYCDHAGTAAATLVRISAALSGHSLQVREEAKNGGHGGLIVLAGGGGVPIASPIAAALYLCRQTSFAAGRNKREECRILEWMNRARDHFHNATVLFFVGKGGECGGTLGRSEKIENEVDEILDTMDAHLADKTYLVGERLTLADLFVFVELQLLVQKMCANPVARARSHLVRWANTCRHQEVITAVCGRKKVLRCWHE